METKESRPPSQGGYSANERLYSIEPAKKASGLEQYFWNRKYNDYLELLFQNTIRDDKVYSMQLEISSRRKALFFINLFGRTARDYFFERYHEDMNYVELVAVMKKVFDNNARLLAVRVFYELVAVVEHLIPNLDEDEDHDQTCDQDAADCDSPSELHIFESVNPRSETAQVTSNEDIPSKSFFDETNRSLPLDRIATHFAGLATPPTPQKIWISEDEYLHQGF